MGLHGQSSALLLNMCALCCALFCIELLLPFNLKQSVCVHVSMARASYCLSTAQWLRIQCMMLAVLQRGILLVQDAEGAEARTFCSPEDT